MMMFSLRRTIKQSLFACLVVFAACLSMTSSASAKIIDGDPFVIYDYYWDTTPWQIQSISPDGWETLVRTGKCYEDTSWYTRVVSVSYCGPLETIMVERIPGYIPPPIVGNDPSLPVANDPTPTVPEPASIALFGLGLLSFVAVRHRSNKTKQA
jgi:hypothetical protein